MMQTITYTSNPCSQKYSKEDCDSFGVNVEWEDAMSVLLRVLTTTAVITSYSHT